MLKRARQLRTAEELLFKTIIILFVNIRYSQHKNGEKVTEYGAELSNEKVAVHGDELSNENAALLVTALVIRHVTGFISEFAAVLTGRRKCDIIEARCVNRIQIVCNDCFYKGACYGY